MKRSMLGTIIALSCGVGCSSSSEATDSDGQGEPEAPSSPVDAGREGGSGGTKPPSGSDAASPPKDAGGGGTARDSAGAGGAAGGDSSGTAGSVPPFEASGPTLVVTTQGAPFVSGAAPSASGTADVTVTPSQLLQVIDGFGGAFNEQGWDALSVLSAQARDAVFSAIFDPASGLRFNICRTPIGASDYAIDRYSLDETAGDVAMASFSIARDRLRLIPYIKAAMKVRPDLKVWASAWSPPTWMKTNGAFNGGAMKSDAPTYDAYALYLAKFVEAYRAEGIDLFMVVPQNEPGQITNYPSCDWTAAQYLTFVRDHLGPLFQQRKPGASIWLGTINSGSFDLGMTLKDTTASAFVEGVCLQWGGLDQVAPLHTAYPTKKIMQSETECGNNTWEAAYNPNKAPNDFGYGAYTWRKFKDFIAAGSSSYMLWNIVLDEVAKNLDGWPQNSAIVIERATKTVTYTPMFWVTKHFSALVEPGAHLAQSSGGYGDRIAFVNPDGTAIVELLNDGTTQKDLKVAVGTRTFAVSLPPKSFATLVVPP